MSFGGVIVGLSAFLLIGLFHPVVIKGEYHFGKKICLPLLIVGVASLIASVFINKIEISCIVAVLGFTCLWSIHEVYEQVERVKKGWYPKKPEKSES